MSDFSTEFSTGASAAMDAISHAQPTTTNKAAGAAKDFEALLLGQMLKSARGDGGWLGTSDDDAGEAAVGLGEEQLARTMAANGGLGLSRIVEAGIRNRQDAGIPAPGAH